MLIWLNKGRKKKEIKKIITDDYSNVVQDLNIKSSIENYLFFNVGNIFRLIYVNSFIH